MYNVGGDGETTIRLAKFLDLLESTNGHRTDISFDDWREGDQKVYVSDIPCAQDTLKRSPSVGIDEGIERYLD